MLNYNLSEEEQYTYLHKIEIDITECCNLSCISCTRGCDKFKGNKDITVDEIRKFVNESIELNYKWDKIGIMGGECTLHPDLTEIINELYIYKKFNESCNIWTMTNGIIEYNFPDWINVVINKDHSFHHAFYVSPTDVNYNMNKNLCHIMIDCGLLYSVYGYLPCPCSNVLHRTFNLNSINSLKDVTYENMISLCNSYCKHCGWYMMDSFTSGKLLEYPIDHMSETWINKLKLYNQYNQRK